MALCDRRPYVAGVGLFRRRIKDGVEGHAQVVSATACTLDGPGRETCWMTLVVQAGDIPAYSVEHRQTSPSGCWPYPGMTLPVTVSRSDPQRLRIDFDQVPATRDVARARADELAAQLRGETTGAATAGIGAVQFVGGSAEDLTPEQRDKVEALLGIDIDGDGVVGSGDDHPVTSTADRISRLERLARLRDTGAITDDEYVAEKRRLLGT